MSFTRCCICHDDHTSAYLTAEGTLIHCAQCALTFAVTPKTKVTYDQQYVAERYDRYETTERMSDLRLQLLEQVLYTHETLPDYRGRFGVKKGLLLDVGYGNGSFIRRCRAEKWDAVGCDVNPTQYEGVRRLSLTEALMSPTWRVVTFFDSLEHFETLAEVRKLVEHTEWLVVTVPLPPEGFPRCRDWKHYRPGEHHLYFHQPWTLEKLFHTEQARAQVVFVGTPEDSIRGKLPDGSSNIQTVILRSRVAKERER